MSSNNDYTDAEKNILLTLASTAIEQGLSRPQEFEIDLSGYSEKLRQIRASFVTLHLDNALRGCIGTLEAHRPLVSDINHNAYAAAFRDPRFSPLTQTEFKHLDIRISVLTPAESMSFSSEDDLLSQIRPGVDGLILTDGNNRGTFLPSVWESLQDKNDFLMELKQKAGLRKNYWSDSIRVERYETSSF